MINKNHELYKNIFIECFESYVSKDDALISYIAEVLKEKKIDIDSYAIWLKNNQDILSTIRINTTKFKMIKLWENFLSNSVSIEDLF